MNTTIAAVNQSTANTNKQQKQTAKEVIAANVQALVELWPFAIGGDLDSQRRRLYNALTRAKNWAVVIVQDDARKASRLIGPPFSKQPQALVVKKKGTKAG
jgi:hypothetical protein